MDGQKQSVLLGEYFAALTEGRWEKAIEALEPGLDDRTLERVLHALALFEARKYAQALELLEQEPADEPAALRLAAYCHIAMGDAEGARLALNRAWIEGMDTRDVFSVYESILYRMGEDNAARTLAAHIPGLRMRALDECIALLCQGRAEEALEVAQSCPEEDADAWTTRLMGAIALETLGRSQEADAALDREAANDAATVNAVRAYLCAMRADASEALASLGEDAAFPGASLIRAWALTRAGRQAEALAEIEGLSPHMLSPQGRIRAADLLFQLGKRDLADAMLAREDDLRPNGDAWFQTLYQRALLKKRAGEPEAASLYHALIENCLVTLNRQPGRTSLCILLGACYRDMGMREKAQEIFGLLRTILPGDARVEALESV